ncbi:DUF4097 family beta strand repeat protein [Pseudidiomarina sp. 1APP75-32.1]|uniref:DUF4097 family beta strand repeat protein n=1 Tax=Pseudidiomarina terrestris TaxID=2820060 RepID=A0AAW7QVQ4_9GAMM|nr:MULTISPECIES: DUF4097 family beta strand repeat-containing protein [unclassified Pseudidiomarina]MDN7123839.1 DUF4097 family beta strand repeat protein [Pseudidiomarina sp. 1APP75-32.1]MDN7127593.1 DUF4097 family beta strand repeat protein [Pseudidiomarina sp. 1APR75-33.1]MEA3588716.1 DUF4097 family beta strand repeat protein [Pseudidiomarina sp. 1APP75-27a]
MMKKLMNLLFSVSVAAVLCAAPTAAFAAQESVDKRLDVPANVVVTIENMRGEVEIIGTEETYAQVRGKLDEYATGMTFELADNNLTIRVEMPARGNFSGNHGSELEIHLPSSAELNISGVSSDFVVRDFSSDVQLNTVSGDIHAHSLRGKLNLTSVSGDIQSEKLTGRVTLKSVSGDIDDRDGAGSNASYSSTSGDIDVRTSVSDISAESVSGDVMLDLQSVSNLRLKSVSGDVKATLALTRNGRISANSVSGDVELLFSGAVDANLEANVSGGGSIVNDVNDARVEESKWGVGANLETRLGSGSGTIELTTMSGDIILRKK